VENVLDGVAAVAGDRGARYAIPVGAARPARGTKVWGSIRRDRITIEKVTPGARPNTGLNAVAGEVHTLENQGSYVKVTVDFGGETTEEFVAYVPDEVFFAQPLDIGDKVVARWSAADVKLLDDSPVVNAPAEVAGAVASTAD
jgi:putative spermidine/putrescine transport system ATP-binding protein